MKRVLVVGSAEKSGGGVSSVIKLIKKMPVWEKYSCYWLGTQIQRNYLWKLWYAIKGNVKALFLIWKYDIVHFHTVPDRLGMIIQMPIFLMAMMLGKKRILHIHMGNQLMGHTGNKLFCWHLKRADKVVLLAEKFKDMMHEQYNLPLQKLAVVYNACEDKAFVDYDNREKTIIMAGYFDENKAPDVLMKAVKHLADHGYDLHEMGWKVILMGNGDVEKYKGICHDLNLTDTISFPGYVTGKKKEDIWRKASIFCLCSHVEGFPMVVLEAWNYGIPVVTTPVGGLPDVIEEDRNCCTFDFDDVEGLAVQIKKLIEDEDMRKSMSNYEQQYVKDHFSMEKVNGQIDALYNML